MRMRTLGLMLGMLLAAPAHWAQREVRGTEVGEGEGEETVGESKIAKIRNVERGIWFSADYGPYYQLPMSLNQHICLNCIGSQVGVRVGYDILNNLEANVFVRGSYAKFIKDYAARIHHVQCMVKKDTTNLKWSPEAEEAFLDIKNALISNPTSVNTTCAVPVLMPSIWVRSTPAKRQSIVRSACSPRFLIALSFCRLR